MGGATNLLSDRLQKIRAGCKRKWEAFQALLVTPVRALLSGQERAGDAPAVANAGHGELDTEESEVLAAPDDHGSEIDCATTAKRRPRSRTRRIAPRITPWLPCATSSATASRRLRCARWT